MMEFLLELYKMCVSKFMARTTKCAWERGWERERERKLNSTELNWTQLSLTELNCLLLCCVVMCYKNKKLDKYRRYLFDENVPFGSFRSHIGPIYSITYRFTLHYVVYSICGNSNMGTVHVSILSLLLFHLVALISKLQFGRTCEHIWIILIMSMALAFISVFTSIVHFSWKWKWPHPIESTQCFIDF